MSPGIQNILYKQVDRSRSDKHSLRLIVSVELQQCLQELSSMGLSINIGPEIEYKLQDSNGKNVEVEAGSIFPTGVSIGQYSLEESKQEIFANDLYEVAVKPCDISNSSDQITLIKKYLSSFYAQQNLQTCFIPQCEEDLGVSLHLNISILDDKNNNILFNNIDYHDKNKIKPKDISHLGKFILNQLLIDLHDATIVFANGPKSYQRYSPEAFVTYNPRHISIGVGGLKGENHSILVRGGKKPGDERIELRLPDHSGINELKTLFIAKSFLRSIKMFNKINGKSKHFSLSKYKYDLPQSREVALKRFQNSNHQKEFWGKKLHSLISNYNSNSGPQL